MPFPAASPLPVGTLALHPDMPAVKRVKYKLLNVKKKKKKKIEAHLHINDNL